MILLGAVGDEAVPYTGQLTDIVRTFPIKLTPVQAADMLYAAQLFAAKVLADKSGSLSQVDDKALYQAQAAAQLYEQHMRAQIPWFWQPTVLYLKSSPQYQQVFELITKIYQEAAGVAGASETITKAREQLGRELDPTTPDFMGPLRPWLIGGGVLLGGILVINLVRRRTQ